VVGAKPLSFALGGALPKNAILPLSMPQGHQKELPNGIRHITAGFDTPDPESLPATLSLNPNFSSDDASEAAAEPYPSLPIAQRRSRSAFLSCAPTAAAVV
jgi:hypothetical protein